ncbi:MAG: helicase-associated domain-containing protein [Chloroflexia bacterium]|nr:helicase-associated domain-containing protein [Chloroflexia bacterium]
MTEKIEAILNAYHTNTLYDMAREAGLAVDDARGKRLKKKALIALMREQFFRQERVHASWQQLSETDRAVLNQLLRHQEPIATAIFRRRILQAKLAQEVPEKTGQHYGYDRSVPYAQGYIGSPYQHNSRVFEDVVARLTLHGLAFSQDGTSNWGHVTYKIQFHPARTLYVPPAVRQHLPKPTAALGKLQDWQPAQVERGDPELLLRDLYLYWDAVRQDEIALLKSGLVGKRSLRAINTVLLRPDPSLEGATREDETGRLYLLRRLLESLELVERRGGRLCPRPPDPLQVPDFWARPLAEQAEACLQAWARLESLNEVKSGEAERFSPDYPQARRALLDVLWEQPAGRWLELDEILNKLRLRDVDFLFGQQSTILTEPVGYYYYRSGYYGSTDKLLEQMANLEEQFVQSCLEGLPHELGLVEIGQDGQNRRGFRLGPTPVGPDGAAGKIVIQPNFQVLALGPVSPAILAQLDLFAEREQADRGAFAYRLSRDAVYRAQQRGLPVSEILHLLGRAGATDVPQNVRRSLQEWAAHYERIVFRRGADLLQAADAELLASLLEDAQTGKHLARAISPEVALLKKGRRKKIFQALLAGGLLPAISGAEVEAADNSVLIQENGEIRAVHAVPNLHLRGRLARLAEETGPGQWRLTPASIRRAGGSHSKVLQALEELERLSRSPLPPALLVRVKAWGRYYGQARTGTLTLVEFHSQKALEELLQHPRLAELLTPFRAGGRALAVVPGEQLQKLAEILDELGVPLKEGISA